MRLDDALPIISSVLGKKFSTLFEQLPEDLIINKGKVGQLLLLQLGLPLDSKLTDFEDGELKTNKADEFGNPLETMFITQISTQADNLLANPPQVFEETNLYKKIKRLVFVPTCKNSEDFGEWFFVSMHLVDLNQNASIAMQIKEDYYDICAQLRAAVMDGKTGQIHTASGKFIQVRSKDSKPYHPIFSHSLGRNISNKNYAFYFKKDFMKTIRSQ